VDQLDPLFSSQASKVPLSMIFLISRAEY